MLNAAKWSDLNAMKLNCFLRMKSVRVSEGKTNVNWRGRLTLRFVFCF